MYRQLYPVLLLIAVALAVAVCLRPSVAEELMTLAQTWGGSAPYPSELLSRGPNGPVSVPGTPHRPIRTSQPVPFPATPAPPRSSPGTAPTAAGSPYPATAPGYRQTPYQQTPYQQAPTRPVPPGPAVNSPYPRTNVGSPVADTRWTPPPPAGQQGTPPASHLPNYPQASGVPNGPTTQAPAGPRSGGARPATPCEGAEILARVGSDVVLASELTASINEIIGQNKDRIPPDQMDVQRKILTKQLLQQQIQFKLIYQDAQRQIPEENLENIRERLAEQFDKNVIPVRMEASGAGSRRQLDEMLRQLGSSLDRQRRQFIERTLAQQWVRQQLEADQEISHQRMLNYYQEHMADFQRPARAQWHELTVRKSNYPTKAQAYATLAAMGNQILDGARFEEVARARSEGVTSLDGGLRDWTTKGALVSDVLDKAIFSLQVGALGPILEDEQGFHIIRVLQRDEAIVTPFLEAQVKIKEELVELARKDQLERYLAGLQEQIPVWTVFDKEEEAQQQASMGSRAWIQ